MNWSAWILALLEQFDDRLVVVAVGTRADQLDLAHDPTERVDLRFVHPDGDIHNGAATSGTAVTTDRWAPRPKIEVREEPVINMFCRASTVSRVTLVRGVFRASAVHKVDDRQCVQILHTVIFLSPTTLMIPSTQ
jgi:hypothetical protein